MEQNSGFLFTPMGDSSDRFTEMQEISVGGFNILVRAKRYGQWWVLKALKPHVRENTVYQNLLYKEYDILFRLQGPSIVKVEGLETVEGYGLCIVMEWIDGVTLDKWLALPHTRKERRDIANKLITAVEFMHKLQIVHRDLKPSNIMITRNGGNVKLIDFGLSDVDNYAILKEPAGTSRYIAPEQKNGEISDMRNDIYSLGVILGKMRLGLAYRLAIKRCVQPLPNRYLNVSDLRQKICAIHRYLVAMVVCLCLMLGGAIGFVYNKVYHKASIFDVVTQFKVGNLKYTSWGGGLVSVKADNEQDSVIEIPKTVNFQGMTYKVDEIEDRGFANHRLLKRLVLPDTKFHVMKNIVHGSSGLKSICFRCASPPVLGNELWPVQMSQVFDAKAFDNIVLYVPQGSQVAYRQSPWGKFRQIQEYK